MRRSSLAAVLALALTSAGLLAQERAHVPLEISVRDVHNRDRSLPGARIEITNHTTGTKIETLTGPDGRASVLVTPGSHRIAIFTPGYRTIVAPNFCVVAGAPARFQAAVGAERPRPTVPLSPPDLTLTPAPLSVPSQTVIGDTEIREAMAFGRRSTKLSGYQLTATRGVERWQVGHLFTPFLRVAMMTQLADATNKQFRATEAPRHFLERFAWVVAGPGRHLEFGGEDETLRYLVAPNDIVVRRFPALHAEEDIKPVWKVYLNTQCDADIFESVLGGRFPQSRGLVAAFPMDALAPGNTIVVTYSSTADPAFFGGTSRTIKPAVRGVPIRDKNLRSWK